MVDYVYEAIKILLSTQDINEFGRLLHNNWMLKKSLSACVSNEILDYIYEKAINAGATGGKVLGAGGGGFVLVFAKPEYHLNIMRALSEFLQIPFSFDRSGTQVIFYSPDDSYLNRKETSLFRDKNCLQAATTEKV
jgi:D-glycero-alpha-D-manno-heptose-7-phosphate kinase